MDQAASITASALLRGARGNSGVILSLLFRGISKGLKGHESAAAAAFAAAHAGGRLLRLQGRDEARRGHRPDRLPPGRQAGGGGRRRGRRTWRACWRPPSREGHTALEQTIDMNPVLKKAGVVDAGGKGFLLILEGMLAELRGEPMPEMARERRRPARQGRLRRPVRGGDHLRLRHRVHRPQDRRLTSPGAAAGRYLNSIGDSLVIGEDDEAFKVHVHTNIPGEALTEAQKYGTLELAKIENMRTQAEDLAAGRHVQSTDDLEAVEDELDGRRGRAAQTAPRPHRRSTTASWPSAPARAWPPSSGTWAATAWSPAARP